MLTAISELLKSVPFLRRESLAPGETWDEELKKKCIPALNKKGFEEDAVLRASKVLEERLRNLLGASPEKTGTQLAQEAFGRQGVLKIGKTEAEQQGLLGLYSGIFLFARNASSHRFVTYTPDSAQTMVAFINQLLQWLNLDSENAQAALGVKKSEGDHCRFFLFDVDGDGKQERIALVQMIGEFSGHCALTVIDDVQPSGLQSHKLTDDTPSESSDCEVRDVDGDGQREIILKWRLGYTHWVRIWRWSGTQYVDVTPGGIFSNAGEMVFKDADGDGKEEIIAYHQKANVPEKRHCIDVVTYHWDGKNFVESLRYEEAGFPSGEATTEDQVMSLVLEYEPATRKFLENLPEHPNARMSWWINKRDGEDQVFHVQLVSIPDGAPMTQTYNHYEVDLKTRQVKSMFYHHADGNLTMNESWP